MKFEVDREVFGGALARARGAVQKGGGMPILANVLMKAVGPDKIEMVSTDLDLSIRLAMEARVNDPGPSAGITLPAKPAMDIVRAFTDGCVSVELRTDNHVEMRSGKSRRALPTIPAEDFPLVKRPDDLSFVECGHAELARAFGHAAYAVPVEDDAFAKSSVFLYRLGSEKLRFAGSDGHRVGFFDLPESAMPGVMVGDGIVVPLKGVQEIMRMIESDSAVSMAIDEATLWARSRDVVLSVQLAQAERPDMESMIPEDRPNCVTMDAEVLHRSLKSVGVLSSGKHQPVRLGMFRDRLDISLVGRPLGEASDELPAQYDGVDGELCMCLRYLSEALGVLGPGPVRIEWVDGMHPIFLARQGDPGPLHLIMPVVV